eukprot:17973-Pleurochrysis_carterae.AAC.1
MASKCADDAAAIAKAKRLPIEYVANALLADPLPDHGSLYVDYLRHAGSGVEMSVHFDQHNPEKADVIKKIDDDVWHLPPSLCGE